MKKNDLGQLLTEERIRHVAEVDSWQKAVELASTPLLQDNSIENTYVDNMKKSVIDNGPYMVLADYFALMHAKPGEGVNEMSLSMLVSDREVNMEGIPVKIFLILAAKDNESHIAALSQITTILMNEEYFKVFLSGDITEILNVINKTGKEV